MPATPLIEIHVEMSSYQSFLYFRFSIEVYHLRLLYPWRSFQHSDYSDTTNQVTHRIVITNL